MNSYLIRAAAAALGAGVVGLALVSAPSAAIKLPKLCPTINGGMISKPGYSSFSGWRNRGCIRHAVRTNHNTRPVRAVGSAKFYGYKGLRATLSNVIKCARNIIVLRFYKRSNGAWQLVQRKRIAALPKIANGRIRGCQADAGSKYALGSRNFRTIVSVVRMSSQTTGRRVASLIRSHPHVH